MRILVTGNNGYIGSVLTNELLKKKYEVIGYDTDYFYNCNLISTKNKVFKNIKKDIRKITEDDLDGIDIVIHLAGLANDPLGDFNPKLTEEINYQSTVKIAKLSKLKKVKDLFMHLHKACMEFLIIKMSSKKIKVKKFL